MVKRKRSLEEMERRAKIRELLQMSNITSMDDIQNLFKDTFVEFMENELDDELGYSKYDYKNKDTTTVAMGIVLDTAHQFRECGHCCSSRPRRRF